MDDQRITSNLPTLERLALNRLAERFPVPLQRRGFASTVRAAFPDIQPQEINIIPDGRFIESSLLAGEETSDCATVTCLEIEDSNPLSAEKLWRCRDQYDTLDSSSCDLRLFVFDRYGLNQRQLNVCSLYLQRLVEMYGSTGPAGARQDPNFFRDPPKGSRAGLQNRSYLKRRTPPGASRLGSEASAQVPQPQPNEQKPAMVSGTTSPRPRKREAAS